MSDDEPDVTIAQVRSTEARQRLADTMVALQARLNPKALAHEAVRELRETGQELARDGVEAMKRNPIGVAGAAAAIGIFLARRPLAKLIGDVSAEARDATASPATSLTKRPARTKSRRTKA